MALKDALLEYTRIECCSTCKEVLNGKDLLLPKGAECSNCQQITERIEGMREYHLTDEDYLFA